MDEENGMHIDNEGEKMDINNNIDDLSSELDELVTNDFLATKSLKKELLELLDNINWYQKAIDFCEVLLDASKDIQGFKSNSDNEQDDDRIIKQLQEIAGSFGSSSRKQLIETFLECFDFSNSTEGSAKDGMGKKFAQVLNMNDTEKIISGMESIINSGNLQVCERYKKYDPLYRLFRILCGYRDFDAGEVLSTIFSAHLANLVYTEEEKKEIGARMVEAIKPIHIYVQDYAFSNELGWSTWMQQRRSALQFIYDDYGKFPVGNNTSLKDNMKGTIEIFDRLIFRFHSHHNHLSETEKDYARYALKGIPKTHLKWWSKVKL